MKKTKEKAPKEGLKTVRELEKMSIKERGGYLYENIKRYDEKERLSVMNVLFGQTIYDENPDFEKELIKCYSRSHIKEEKRQIWEVNHSVILNEIHKSLKEGHFPSATIIAQRAGLSRTTVHKHLDSFDSSQYYETRKQKLKMSVERMLTSLYFTAMNYSDNKCKDLFLKYATKILESDAKNTTKAPQTTFIQVNNIYVNQDTFLNLAPAKREQIEQILLSENISDNSPKLDELDAPPKK
jgi:hypothetical protein